MVIKLSDRLEDTLSLRESVLAKASERFAMRFNSRHWAPSQDVDAGGNGEKIKVYDYRLIHADGTYTLTDEVCCRLIIHYLKIALVLTGSKERVQARRAGRARRRRVQSHDDSSDGIARRTTRTRRL